MEPLALTLVAFNFAGSLVAQKIADDAVEQLWVRVKLKIRKLFDRDPAPADFIPGSEFLIRADSAILQGAESAAATTSAFRRATLVRKVFEGARILWVDDDPRVNTYEAGTFRALGSEVEQAFTTDEAVARIDAGVYDLVISAIIRGSNAHAGSELLSRLLKVHDGTAVIFYLPGVDASRDRPSGSAGITNRPDELLHLAMDVLERTRM